MPYNKLTDTTAGYISPEHKLMLNKLRIAHKRTLRAELEWLIESQLKKEGIK